MVRVGSPSSARSVDQPKQAENIFFEQLISKIEAAEFDPRPLLKQWNVLGRYEPIKRNVYHIKRRTEDYGIFCSCKPSSSSSVACGKDCHCGMLFSCCSSNCECDNSCANKPFQHRPLKHTKLITEAAHPDEDVSLSTAWAMSHQTRVAGDVTWDPAAPREAYTDPNVYTKVQEYTSAVQQRHGPEYDVRTEPIDAEAIMRLGGGRKHDRAWIANAAIDPTTVPTLSQLRAQSTSSSQPIRSRATPTLQRVDALEARNIEQTAQITALTARLEAEQAAREAQEVRIVEMMQIMQALGQKTGVPVQMSAPPPHVPHAFAATPPQSAGSNNLSRASPDTEGFVTPLST